MISIEIFLLGLLASSTMTGLFTEAIKKLMNEYNVNYRANTLAGAVSFVIATAIGIGYVLMTGLNFNTQSIVCIVALVVMSWLCAMVGYDKVMQTVGQFKMDKKE